MGSDIEKIEKRQSSFQIHKPLSKYHHTNHFLLPHFPDTKHSQAIRLNQQPARTSTMHMFGFYSLPPPELPREGDTAKRESNRTGAYNLTCVFNNSQPTDYITFHL